jgi:hypothetical protein
MSESNLNDANLSGANLTQAKLRKTSLSNTNLENTILTKAVFFNRVEESELEKELKESSSSLQLLLQEHKQSNHLGKAIAEDILCLLPYAALNCIYYAINNIFTARRGNLINDARLTKIMARCISIEVLLSILEVVVVRSAATKQSSDFKVCI